MDFFPNDPAEEVLRDLLLFNYEYPEFELPDPERYETWLRKLIDAHSAQLDALSYVFCSDEQLLAINLEHLEHDTYTDIITFPYREPPILEGDIFISVERIGENARKFRVPFVEELQRVMAHGVLHLIGFGDKSEAEAAEMRRQEQRAIGMFSEP